MFTVESAVKTIWKTSDHSNKCLLDLLETRHNDETITDSQQIKKLQ